MKLHAIDRGHVLFALDATDCLQLADACAHAIRHDVTGDYSLIQTLRAALRLGAVVAAFDTIQDNETPEAEMLAHAREVWGPDNTSAPGRPRVAEPE